MTTKSELDLATVLLPRIFVGRAVNVFPQFCETIVFKHSSNRQVQM